MVSKHIDKSNKEVVTTTSRRKYSTIYITEFTYQLLIRVFSNHRLSYIIDTIVTESLDIVNYFDKVIIDMLHLELNYQKYYSLALKNKKHLVRPHSVLTTVYDKIAMFRNKIGAKTMNLAIDIAFLLYLKYCRCRREKDPRLEGVEVDEMDKYTAAVTDLEVVLCGLVGYVDEGDVIDSLRTISKEDRELLGLGV